MCFIVFFIGIAHLVEFVIPSVRLVVSLNPFHSIVCGIALNSLQDNCTGPQPGLVMSNSGEAPENPGLLLSNSGKALDQPGLLLSNSGKALDQTGKKQYVKQVTGRHNDTELHLAVKKGDLEAVKQLLGNVKSKNGLQSPQADHTVIDIEMGESLPSLVDEVNELGETPLYLAAEQGHLEVLKELLKFAHPETLTKKNRLGYDVLHIAAKQGHIGIVKEILNLQPGLSKTFDLSNATPLISAAIKGHVEVVNELLAKDCQLIEIARSNGKNALHFAARSGYTEIVTALLEKDPHMVRREDRKGQTALHMAAKGANCLEVVKVLLKVDPAIVMMPDKKGNTALHVATRKKREEIVRELLKMQHISVNTLNRSNQTAMDLAEELPYSEAATEIKACLADFGGVRAKGLNQPRDELKKTVSEIKHDVLYQLRQTEKTNKNVNGIAKDLKKLHREGINNATNSVTVVAVLFATVAFAAIFTVPGGNINSGEATVANRASFQIFFVFNAIALFTSLAVVIVQITLVRWETRSQRKVVEVINKLMWLASVCTTVAFVASAYIVVGRHAQWLAFAVTFIGGIIMVSVFGTMTYFIVKFKRSRSFRRLRRSSNSRSSSWNLPSEFSESEIDSHRIYAI
ncbi:ankyrin repeat-containing protein ITN1 isoform X1 [Cryptomeria japonica]|uniref:ankyrin repeat-containing protein ITN1 isoform X1 n=2 Tax=Cryptomeria japonica TaxID=3369 RepID=UPI0025AB7574|nr:ankyrin repeat-containing protein ITN1 isoform X1 [Cryptomeria japonica]